jgi:hypothetical protein
MITATRDMTPDNPDETPGREFLGKNSDLPKKKGSRHEELREDICNARATVKYPPVVAGDEGHLETF